MSYNELTKHGKQDFPFALYRINNHFSDEKQDFHWHTNIEIIRILRGAMLLTLDNRSLELRAGDIVFINSETLHSITVQFCDYECLTFDAAFLKNGNDACDEFIENLLQHRSFLTEHPVDSEIASLCHHIFNEFDEEKAGRPFKIIGFLQILFGLFQEKGYYTNQPTSPVHDTKKILKLKAVLGLIHENYKDEITLEDMAMVTGLSRQYFCKFFKDMTKLTPVQYLLQYRMEQAVKKLRITDFPVNQIAYLCGFNDVGYFIRVFKAAYGVSPAEYRKK